MEIIVDGGKLTKVNFSVMNANRGIYKIEGVEGYHFISNGNREVIIIHDNCGLTFTGKESTVCSWSNRLFTKVDGTITFVSKT